MICRLWRGWTTADNADAYERIVRGQVIPGIEARHIDGFRHIDLMKADCGDEDMEPLVRRLSAFALRALSNPQAETLP